MAKATITPYMMHRYNNHPRDCQHQWGRWQRLSGVYTAFRDCSLCGCKMESNTHACELIGGQHLFYAASYTCSWCSAPNPHYQPPSSSLSLRNDIHRPIIQDKWALYKPCLQELHRIQDPQEKKAYLNQLAPDSRDFCLANESQECGGYMCPRGC